MNHPRSELGYALIESMVALALFAAMTGLLFQVIQTTATARQHLADVRQASLIAQSRLTELQARQAGMRMQGRDGAFQWRAEIQPYQVGIKDNSVGLEQISITVIQAASGMEITTVKSLRLAR